MDVLGELGRRDRQLAYVDALLTVKRIARRPNLLLKRAELLKAKGEREAAAAEAWRLMLDYPTHSAARRADTLLRDLKRRGVKLPTSSARLELARIRTLIRARAWSRAEKAIEEMEAKHPKLKRALTMKRAQLHKARRQRPEEVAVLEKLYAEGLTDDDGPAILERLGRLAMNLDDNGAAIARFDELVKRFPESEARESAQYLAGWIHYDLGQFGLATKRMLAFAEALPKSKKRDEALWWAGWSAYLAKDYGVAREALTRLMNEHARSSLVPHARYWIGRSHQLQGDLAAARAAYAEAHAKAPLTYYGFWAAARLAELGAPVDVTPPPPAPAPASMREALARLGLSRPTNLDRAVVLHAAGLEDEVLDELDASARYLRRIRDAEGRTVVADLLAQLGAHHLAFRLGMRVAAGAATPELGGPWAWRAWRHAYPPAFETEVSAASETHDVDPLLVRSIMRTESHFRPWVRSRVGARGLMQLMPATARRIGRRAEDGRRHAARYRNPDSNVWLGTWYIGQLLLRYDGQIPLAAGAYNAGPRAMQRWLDANAGVPLDEFVERITYKETRRYVRRVMETYMVYQRLYGGEMPALVTQVKKPSDPNAGVAF